MEPIALNRLDDVVRGLQVVVEQQRSAAHAVEGRMARIEQQLQQVVLGLAAIAASRGHGD